MSVLKYLFLNGHHFETVNSVFNAVELYTTFCKYNFQIMEVEYYKFTVRTCLFIHFLNVLKCMNSKNTYI